MAFQYLWPLQTTLLTLAQVSALLCLCLIPVVFNRLLSGPLSEIPGPLSARFSRLECGWPSIVGMATCTGQ